ncbi:MAG: methyl-accepting chemotaxis protein, partial [Planctomycetota bacterium]
MTIRTKLALAFGLALALLVAQAALTNVFVSQLQRASGAMSASATGFRLSADVSDALNAFRKEVNRTAEAEDPKGTLEAGAVYWEHAQDQIRNLIDICLTFGFEDKAKAFQDGMTTAAAEIASLQSAVGKHDEEAIFEHALYVDDALGGLLETLSGATVQLRDALEGAVAREKVVRNRPRQAAIFITAGAFALLAVVGFFFSRSVTRPILAVVAATQRLAQGDLTVQLQANRKDELGRLARAVNAMTESLARLIEGVQRSAEDVTGASDDIAASSGEVAQGMDRQREETRRA